MGAVYLSAKVAMSFGRDVRGDLFHRVTDFSAREVNQFGAPSLITRITNDVQQVQMLVVMACTFAVAAHHNHRRERAGAPAGRRPVVAGGGGPARPGAQRGIGGVADDPAVPHPMGAHRRGQPRCCASRSPASAVARAGDREVERFGVNDQLTDVSLKAGRLMALMFPMLLFIITRPAWACCGSGPTASTPAT